MKNKIDPIEIETTNSYFYTIINLFIALGFIAIVFSPFIIDHFTK